MKIYIIALDLVENAQVSIFDAQTSVEHLFSLPFQLKYLQMKQYTRTINNYEGICLLLESRHRIRENKFIVVEVSSTLTLTL